MMRILKIVLIALVVGGLILPGLGCRSESETAPLSESEVVTVERGNLTIDITAVGNLALSLTDDLAFEIAGTVEEVLVEEGDTVAEGEILAKLDTSDWEEQLSALADKVTAAERRLTVAERQLTSAQRQVTTKQRSLLQVEITLKKAELALADAEALYVWPDEIFAARRAVWNAESALEEAQGMLGGGVITEVYDRETGTVIVVIEQAITPWDIKIWTQKLADAEERLRQARVRLDDLLAASAADTEEVVIKRLEVALAQGKVADAQIAIEDAQIAVEDAEIAVEDEREDLEDAQEALDEAKDESPLITAPFDGFVIKVNVEGGDEVLKGTVAVVVADANKFEADIMVSEMDILQVQLGGEAWVQVDAMQELRLAAEVTHISPTATIQSGVVNYKVKVEIASLTPLESTPPQQQAQAPLNLERLYQVLGKAVEEGKLTREEADAWRERWEQRATDYSQEQVDKGVERLERFLENLSREQIEQFQARLRQGVDLEESYQRLDEALEAGRITQEQADRIRERLDQWKAALEQPQRPKPAMVPQDFQLREGLTVTVSILVEERVDVLLVPNKAITRRGGETYVLVLEDGATSERLIQTGISDYQNTEVTDGLSEGEQIVVAGAAAKPEESTRERRRGLFR